MTRAFDDIRVLDLSNRLSGAYAARMYGDFGAEVILAERLGGHTLRASPVLHAYANWNKQSVKLQDTSELLKFIDSSDVIITDEIDQSDPIISTENERKIYEKFEWFEIRDEFFGLPPAIWYFSVYAKDNNEKLIFQRIDGDITKPEFKKLNRSLSKANDHKKSDIGGTKHIEFAYLFHNDATAVLRSARIDKNDKFICD